MATKNIEVNTFIAERSTSLYGKLKTISNPNLAEVMGVLNRRNINDTQIYDFGYDRVNSVYFVILK